MKLNDIIHKDEYVTYQFIPEELEIDFLTRKIDEIKEGTLFFLLKSINQDSENIINNINSKKPAVIVCQKTP